MGPLGAVATLGHLKRQQLGIYLMICTILDGIHIISTHIYSKSLNRSMSALLQALVAMLNSASDGLLYRY